MLAPKNRLPPLAGSVANTFYGIRMLNPEPDRLPAHHDDIIRCSKKAILLFLNRHVEL